MIKGIGIDIIKINYIDKMLKKYGDTFLFKYYSLKEINLFKEKIRNANHFLSGRFAAKEAFLKAISTGLNCELEFNEIEILNEDGGKPFLNINEHISKYVNEVGEVVHISISHHEEYAVALIIIEKGD